MNNVKKQWADEVLGDLLETFYQKLKPKDKESIKSMLGRAKDTLHNHFITIKVPNLLSGNVLSNEEQWFVTFFVDLEKENVAKFGVAVKSPNDSNAKNYGKAVAYKRFKCTEQNNLSTPLYGYFELAEESCKNLFVAKKKVAREFLNAIHINYSQGGKYFLKRLPEQFVKSAAMFVECYKEGNEEETSTEIHVKETLGV